MLPTLLMSCTLAVSAQPELFSSTQPMDQSQTSDNSRGGKGFPSPATSDQPQSQDSQNISDSNLVPPGTEHYNATQDQDSGSTVPPP